MNILLRIVGLVVGLVLLLPGLCSILFIAGGVTGTGLLSILQFGTFRSDWVASR